MTNIKWYAWSGCLFTFIMLNEIGDGKVFVCYYVRTARLPVSGIPPNLCTHITYAFAHVTPNGIAPDHVVDTAYYKELSTLKGSNPQLKVMLSLQNGFSTVVDAGPQAMEIFCKKAVTFLRQYTFDGVDFDWEFPSKSQKNSYMKLLSIFRSQIQLEAKRSGLSPLLLSMALTNNRYIAAAAYDMKIVNRSVDFATVMAYDFHLFIAKVDNITGYNSALFSPRGESQYNSGSGMVKYYLTVGLSPEKLVLGVPTYGRSYTLANPSLHGLHAPATSRGAPGPSLRVSGLYNPTGVCIALKNGAKRVWDPTSGVPYLFQNTTWVSYEDEESARGKCTWALEQKLAGIGIWSLNLDDVTTECTTKPFPILREIKDCLRT